MITDHQIVEGFGDVILKEFLLRGVHRTVGPNFLVFLFQVIHHKVGDFLGCLGRGFPSLEIGRLSASCLQ